MFGVGHVETIFTTPGSDTVIFDPSSRLPVALAVPIVWPPSPSAFVGVGHVACAIPGNFIKIALDPSGFIFP